MRVRIALIGLGAIGTEVLRALQDDRHAQVAQVLVRPARVSSVGAEVGTRIEVIAAAHQLSSDIDFVVECAGHGAVSTHVPEILQMGIDVGVVSIGALADEETLSRVRQAGSKGRARAHILPGAIGGLDALAAAGERLEHVRYQSRKPPLSWSGSPAEDRHDLGRITQPTAVFEGTAREAALQFPKNANVVATVALAGVGFERTKVTLMADPDALGNSHAIAATGPGYDLQYTTSGPALPDNPKTSALTALSVLRAIKSRAPGIVI